MTALADRRARISRVRRVQHLQAAGAVAAAEERVVSLQANADRLAAMRESLVADAGSTSGATLGSIGELSMRLEAARDGLARAIGQARDVVALRVTERTDAHIARESAERLQVRAVAEMQREIEQRMAASIRPRMVKSRG